MPRVRAVTALPLVLALGAAGVFYANAGDLNPPPGPVQPTGVTLTEIAGAVAGVQSSVNALGGTSSGSELTLGLTIPGFNGEGDRTGVIPPPSVAVLEYELGFRLPVSPSGPGFGAPTINRFSLLVEVDTAYPEFYEALTLIGLIPNLTIDGFEVGSGPPMLRERVTATSFYIVELTRTTTSAGQDAVQMELLVTGEVCIQRISSTSSPTERCFNFTPTGP